MADKRPIFIIGAARSGTKFLRDVLASGAGTAAVPYDVNYVWRYGATIDEDDVLDPAYLTPKRTKFIQKTLRTLAKANTEDILIEKTVANTLRVPFVDAVFPDARYVHVIRDGRDVAESAMRQWSKSPDWRSLAQKLRDIPLRSFGYVIWFGKNYIEGLFSKRGGGKVWGPRFTNINAIVEAGPLSKVCATQWLESYTRATHDLSRIENAESRVYTLRYESLISDESALIGLINHLELPDRESILENYRRKLNPNEAQLWRSLSKDDLAIFDEIMTPALSQLGYKS